MRFTLVKREIFNRAKKRMQKSWASKRHDREEFQYFRQEVADQTADRVLNVKRAFYHVLELGADQGQVSSKISPNAVSYLIQCDPCPYVTHKSVSNENVQHCKAAVDECRTLPYKSNTFDLVICNLNLHWANDLNVTFSEINRVLRPDAAIMGSIWANDSLYELRQSLQLAELERRGGVGNRVGPLTSGDSFSNALHTNKFKLITCDLYEKVYGYPSIFELVEDLQLSGESQCANDFRPLHPDILMCAAGIYQSMYGDEYGIQATMRAVNFIAWKASASQDQYIKKRGSTPKGIVQNKCSNK